MKTVGIIGGGQLGMMLAQAIHKLGGKAICLDPNPNCSAGMVCEECIVSAYDNLEGLKELGEKCDVLTYEFENVPADILKYIVSKYNIPQGVEPLFDSQNRIREKKNAQAHGLQTPRFYEIHCEEDLKEGIKKIGYPCVFKTTTLGYDGHGQVWIRKEEDIKEVKPFLSEEGILEEYIPYDYETSIIMVRNKEQIISFPMTVNYHKKGILDLCVADKEKEIFSLISASAKRFMISCGYYGILTIEFFVKGDRFYFNEMAPRPHNSGHYTIEGCNTSQYAELAKFLMNQPLTTPKLKSPTIMKNILGYNYENMIKFVPNEKTVIHDYYKKDVRPYRKMGHITFIDTTLKEYEAKYKMKFKEEEYE